MAKRIFIGNCVLVAFVVVIFLGIQKHSHSSQLNNYIISANSAELAEKGNSKFYFEASSRSLVDTDTRNTQYWSG